MLDAFINLGYKCETCFQSSPGRIFRGVRLVAARCCSFGFLRGAGEAFLSKEAEEEGW